MPRPSYSYVVAAPGGPFLFMAHPQIPGAWLRTHPCVAVVPCEICSVAVGEPCRNRDGRVGSWVHWDRKKAGRDGVARLQQLPVLISKTGRPRKSA